MEPIAVALLAACLVIGVIVLAGVSRLENQTAALFRLEAKLDLLLADAGLSFDPFANVLPEVAEALQRGEKIKAIKLYREATQVGLKEAKEYVDAIQRRAGTGA